MSFDRCVYKNCCSPLLVSYPQGHNPEHPWMLTHRCRTCDQHWFTCDGMCRTSTLRRTNSFYTTITKARRHYLQCHLSSDSNRNPAPAELEKAKQDQLQEYIFKQSQQTIFTDHDTDRCPEEYQFSLAIDEECLPLFGISPLEDNEDEFFPLGPAYDGDVEYEVVETDLQYDQLISIVEPEKNEERFKGHITQGNALLAASVLVAQAAFQTPMPSSSMLPLPNIMLFLYLSKLVMSSGLSQQFHLAKVLAILYPYADSKEKSWAPIPCTVSGFRSKISNVSNSNSLVSILPIPSPETLPDGHGYTPFRNILSHALMLNKFLPTETKDPKWQSLVSCEKFKPFLNSIPTPTGGSSVLQIAVGIIVWTDGWDTSTGCKSNRSPMHTGTVTLLFVTVLTGKVIGIATYPNMGGPGKIDHGPVFDRFQQDIAAFESADNKDRVFASRHHSRNVEIHTQILFVVQDQPERRQASGLLGGGSNLHPMFGMSCDFNKLELPFNACTQCEVKVHEYIEAANWSLVPMPNRCNHCLSWKSVLPKILRDEREKG